MPYGHNENIKELTQKEEINDAFDYTFVDPFKVVETYFQFCQENLSEECGEYDIHPARVYIRADRQVNGRATQCL